MLSERECADCLEDDAAISMEVRNRLGRIRKATDLALPRLAAAPLDTLPGDTAPSEDNENCQNEPAVSSGSGSLCFLKERAGGEVPGAEVPSNTKNCQNEPEANEPAPTPTDLNPSLTGEGARHEREGSPSDAPVTEVDPRTHPAFLGRNEVPRPLPYAALHRREDHRVIHAAARAQSYRNARDADKPYF